MLTLKDAILLRYGKRQHKTAAAGIGVSPVTVSRWVALGARVLDFAIYTPNGCELTTGLPLVYLSDWCEDASMAKIAKKIGCDRETVRRWAKKGAVILHGYIYLPTGYTLPQVTPEERSERLRELLALPFQGRQTLGEWSGWESGPVPLMLRYGLIDLLWWEKRTHDEWADKLQGYL